MITVLFFRIRASCFFFRLIYNQGCGGTTLTGVSSYVSETANGVTNTGYQIWMLNWSCCLDVKGKDVKKKILEKG